MTSPNITSPDSASKFNYTEHVIDQIMPAREVHLFAGPSGAGKTTLLMKMMESISRGENIFGHKSTASPFVYISGDRGWAGMQRTMDRLQIADKSAFPLFIAPSDDIPIAQVIAKALEKYPSARLVVIEGLATWVPDGKLIDYKVVAKFLRSLQKLCETRNITVWGVVHTAKVKPNEKYVNPRERIMGSAAWGAFAETIFYMEPEEPNDIDNKPMRRLMILPRNAKEESFRLDFRDGLLIPVTKSAPIPRGAIKSNYTTFMEYFDPLEAGSQFTLAEVKEKTGLCDSSARFEIKKAIDSKLLAADRSRPAGSYIKQSDRAKPSAAAPDVHVDADLNTVN